MKKMLLISLFFLVSSEIEFGKEIPYNTEQDFAFKFDYEGNGPLFIYVTCKTNNNLEIAYSVGGNTGRSSINRPGEGIVIDPSSGKTYQIALIKTNDLKDNGNIWVNPSTNEIEVNLNKKYEIKFPFVAHSITSDQEGLYQLVYVIKNAEKDANFNFQYSQNVEDEKVTIPNPFQICHGNDCKSDNIESYKFTKGESYKIYVKAQKVDDEYGSFTDYVLPPFSFADENYKESNGDNGSVGDNGKSGTAESSQYYLHLRFNLWIISLFLLFL